MFIYISVMVVVRAIMSTNIRHDIIVSGVLVLLSLLVSLSFVASSMRILLVLFLLARAVRVFRVILVIVGIRGIHVAIDAGRYCCYQCCAALLLLLLYVLTLFSMWLVLLVALVSLWLVLSMACLLALIPS